MNQLRLKSLELNGYKTFATKTNFEFSGLITSIVGPNGSGKSNIADALRWVLGEQSFSLLRARKTDDMIFSGSEKRARAGMASATVTFDNSEGWLPIDFSEVSITRRAYRDGQNEYLINRQKVRLRDVNELLSQSALAERTYTVIGQGLIDSTLSLSSEERRRLFEEAAGVGLYRTRKDQALRRLDATRRNLERVEDILAELKPRMRSLERQAQRALEFSSLRDEMRDTLRVWYGFHWNRAQNDLRAVREAAKAREENLGLARQKQSELSAEVNQLRTRSQELRNELNTWHRRLSELHSGREGASRDLAVADERERALAERRLSLKAEQQRLRTVQASLQARLKESEAECGRLDVEMQEAQGQLDQARQTLEDRLEVQRERDSKGLALSERVASLTGQKNTLIAQQEQLKLTLERQTQEAAEVARAIEAADEELEEARRDLNAKQALAQQAEAALDEAQTALHETQQSIREEETEVLELEKQQRTLVGTQARLEGQLDALEEAEATAAGFAEGARKLQQAAQEKRLNLARGTLGRELRLDAELEAAISAALGQYLDAVAVSNAGDTETALALLEDQDASGVLLPLATMASDGRMEAPGGQGVLGVAADLVEVADELRPAVDLLLGHVLLVRDRQTAQRVLPTLTQDARAVTLRGEVFYRRGPIEVRSAKSSGSLARPRQERNLRAELEKAVRELAGVEEQFESASAQLSEYRRLQDRHRSELEAAARQVEDARSATQSAQLDIQQLEKQRDWFLVQQRSTQRELAEGGERLQTIAIEEGDLVSKITETEQQLELHNGQVTELPMDEPQAQVAHWEMRQAVSQRALQEAQRRRDERQGQLTSNQQSIEEQQLAQTEIERQERNLEEERQRLRLQQGEVGGEIGELQARIAPAEEELSATEIQQDRLQRSEIEAMQALSSAERAHTQAQISLARQQESLETLRGRIEDDFGLVAFEYDDSVSGPTPLPLGNLVERLPVVESLEPELENRLKEQRIQVRRLGSVNPEAQEEFTQVKNRFEDMTAQVADLTKAETDLQEVIAELDILMEKEFRSTFDEVAAEFRVIFSRLFNGGAARLILTDEEDMTNTGIDIEARLPGKRAQRLALLSGGERSLTATALIFALIKASPTPFCVMDEVDAMLDEANVGRFTQLLEELSVDTQFVLITHNRNTVQVSDVIYGITMGRDTASQMISLRLDEVDERYSSN